MALENEELQKAMADYARSMQGLGTANAAATKAANDLAKAQTTLAQKTASAINQIDALASGGGSFKSLNGVIDLTAKAVGGLLSIIPGVGGALKEMAGAVGEAAKYAMAQFDQLAQNYQALGESSAMASDGIDGMQRQFRAIGLVSLPAFAKAISQNSVGLTAFGGSITDGAEQFSKLAGEMTKGDIGQGFLKLGMSFDQVGESTGKFVGTFSRYGLTQGKTFEELKKSTVDYMLEVDQIARITGQNRKQQEDEQRKNEADVRFRAKLADMRDRGLDNEAQELATYVAGLGGAQGEAARAMLTGVAMTDQANKANQLSMDQLRQNTLAVANGQKKAAVAIEDTQKGMAQGAKQYRGLLMTAGGIFGGAEIAALDAEQMVKARAKYEAQGMTAAEATAKAQQDLLKAGGKTEQFTDAQQKVAGINKDMANLTFNSMTAAMGAVDGFASAIKKVTGFVDEKFGGGKKPEAEGEKKSFLQGIFGGSSQRSMAAEKTTATAAKPAEVPANTAAKPAEVPANIEKYLKATALIESGGKADAKAGTSSASGMFQFINSTWAQTVKEMGKNYTAEDRFDPAKATEVMAYFTSKQKSQLEKGTGKEASNVDLYMAHFLGAGGATKFINAMAKNPAMSAAAMDPAAAAANKSIYFDQGRERSLQEVYGLMGQKMGKAEGAVESGKWGGKDIPQAVAAITSQMGAKTPAGPASGYAGNQLAAATPQSSLPTNPGQPAAGSADPAFNDKMLSFQQAQAAALAAIAKNTQQQVDVSKKIQSRQT
jgi:hypothetical protein